MLVAVNSGHCIGLDPGCIGLTITEAELAQKYAKLLEKYLNAVGINTLYIMEDDLDLICQKANNANADLFISIHFNSFETRATGTETLYCQGSVKGKIFASCVQKQLVDTLGLPDRGIKTNSIYVTRHTDMPAVLVEVGFLANNPDEEKILISRMDDAVRAIARGITDTIIKLS